MKGLAFIFALVAIAECAKISKIEGIPLQWLRDTQPGSPQPVADWAPTPLPNRPLSMRILYRTFVGTTFPSNEPLILEGLDLTNAQAKLLLGTAPAAPQDCRVGGTLLTKRIASTDKRVYFDIGLPAATLAHEFLYPWVCVSPDGVNWIHSNLRVSIRRGCLGDATGQAASALTSDLCQNIAVAETAGRGDTAFAQATAVNTHLWIERKQRVRCCGWRDAGFKDLQGNTLPLRYGICINPLVDSCCSRVANATQGVENFNGVGGVGKPFSKFREKCCYGGNATFQSSIDDATRVPPEPVIISYVDDYCPCTAGRVNAYCNEQYPSKGTNNLCCTQTKYPELNTGAENIIWGKCYDGDRFKCCDTGDIYDAGSKQCCAINGVQSLNIPCPCSSDSHCTGDNQRCCGDLTRPLFPAPQENTTLCNKYVNYPSGTGPVQNQPCIGQCIDTRFQVCCNGKICMDAFETCCNSTCCNKFNQRCTMGFRSGAAGQPSNPRNFRVPYEYCTSQEALTPFRAIVVFFVPIILLWATLIGLAATLFFAKRQNALQPLSAYEKSMVYLSFLVILFSWPLYFSPLFVYGVLTIWAAFIALLAGLSQLRPLNIGAIVVLGVLLIYLVDPFYGNEILTLAFNRVPPPADSVHGTTGILAALATQYLSTQSWEGVAQADSCVNWYDYFSRSPNTEDRLRFDNPEKFTFGFCQRDWFTALGIFEVINILLVFLLFFVTLITHLRNVLFTKAEKAEEVIGWY